jgi:glycosyltransferase involved in cell wall biosynthesis
MKKVSIIVPMYNEQEAAPYFFEALDKVIAGIQGYEFEIVAVNDGSKDETLNILKEEFEKRKNLVVVNLSRNWGHECAVRAGFINCTGDCAIPMDADLQDPPEVLEKMYIGIVEEGYDCVGTRRVTRKGEPPIRSFFARCFYKIINKLSSTEMVDGARDFRLMTRQMLNSILSMKEYNRYSKGLFSFVGYKTKWLEYENVERVAGKTKWSFFKLLIYAIDGIVAFSTKPLIISALIGLLFFLISFIMIIVIIVKTLAFGDPVSGWPSLVCIIFFVSGIQLFCTGIMGTYLAKTYLETKGRPIYIVKETERDNNEK